MRRNMDYQKKDQPIYDYYIGTDGRLHIRKHEYYSIVPAGPNRVAYRICPEGRSDIIIKRENQLDRFLNGHYFSLKKDAAAAINGIKSACVKRIEDAQMASARAQSTLQAISDAAKLPEVED